MSCHCTTRERESSLGSHDQSEFEGISFESDAFEADEFGAARLGGEEEGIEMQLAAELLGVSDAAEFEEFLGGLLQQAAGATSSFLKSPAGRQLGGLLKSAAKRALPQVGRALGGQLGGARGADLGGKVAASAGRVLGLEVEGLSQEDRDFEMARQFVRLARDAGAQLAGEVGSAAGASSAARARNAYLASARRHAPGLVTGSAIGISGSAIGTPLSGFPSSGRWFRRGRTITLT